MQLLDAAIDVLIQESERLIEESDVDHVIYTKLSTTNFYSSDHQNHF